jgi:hypothetical protein
MLDAHHGRHARHRFIHEKQGSSVAYLVGYSSSTSIRIFLLDVTRRRTYSLLDSTLPPKIRVPFTSSGHLGESTVAYSTCTWYDVYLSESSKRDSTHGEK